MRPGREAVVKIVNAGSKRGEVMDGFSVVQLMNIIKEPK
jgi:hypothetical protein